jgi:hypothetical protein
MGLKLLAKDENSGRNGCPSIYIDETGMAVVQGPEVEDAVKAAFQNPLPGETGVRIAPQVLITAAAKLQQR